MHSLRARLWLATSSATLALVLTYVWVIPGVVFVTEDVVFERVVARTLAGNVASYTSRGTLERDPDWLDLELGLENLTPDLRDRVQSLGPGVHELNDMPGPDGTVRELFLGVDFIERSGQRVPLVVIADVTPFEAYERIPAPFFVGVIAFGLALAALLATAGLLLSLRLFGALGRLQALVSLDDDGEGFFRGRRDEFRDDEVGRLGARLAESSERLAVAMQRERDFTRDASHELRTPLTVARGAVELLEQHLESSGPTDEDRLRRLLLRLRIAHGNMEGIVRVFLWLARDPVHDEDLPRIDISSALADVQRDLETMARLRGTEPALSVECTEPLEVAAPPEVVAAVIRNLLQNALRHAHGRPVAVVVRR